jgi:hypothetical protein
MLKFISVHIGGMIDVIELLNEPGGFLGDTFAQTVRQFWLDGYDTVRASAGGGIKIMIGDAFLGVQVRSISYHEFFLTELSCRVGLIS